MSVGMYSKSMEKKKRPALNDVGRRLRSLRGNRTTVELADLIGVTDGAIRMWESGARDPGVDGLLQIAKALGVSPLVLLSDTPPPPPPPALTKTAAYMAQVIIEQQKEIEALQKPDLTPDELKLLTAYRKASAVRKAQTMVMATDDPQDFETFLRENKKQGETAKRQLADLVAQAIEQPQAPEVKPSR